MIKPFIANENISFLLNDNREVASPNLKKFFSVAKNQFLTEIIRFEGHLWFVLLGWRVYLGCDTGFAGCTVKEAACQGKAARSCYPGWQNGNDYEIVTDWFWDKYKAEGKAGFPEIWFNYEVSQS